MNENHAKKLADVFDPIKPSAELLAQTEALMRAAQRPKPAARKPIAFRAVAMAACLLLICSAALTYALTALPSDLTGVPGPGLTALAASDASRSAVPMPATQRAPLTEAELTIKAQNTHGTTAAAMLAEAVCTDAVTYVPDNDQAGFTAAIFATFSLKSIDFRLNLPQEIKKRDKITAVILCYDDAAKDSALAMLDTSGETAYKLWLSTSADGDLYAEDGATVLASSAWMLHDVAPAALAD